MKISGLWMGIIAIILGILVLALPDLIRWFIGIGLIVMGVLGLKQELLWIGAEVVRTDVASTPKPEQAMLGIGVQFTTVSGEDYQFLQNVVSELLHLANP